jgi:Zn-dependent protease with chaperone function
VDAFYQQAIAAFKAQDYEQALARFQRLEQLPPTSIYHIKALMGRVRIYQRLGQGNQVKRLCLKLLNSPSPQAQTWASQVLSQFSEQAAIASVPNVEPQTAARADLSGFVPLENSKNLPRQTPAPGSQSIPPTGPDQNVIQATTVQETADILAQDAPETESRSLFHYQQLNQQPAPESKNTKATLAGVTPSASPSSPTPLDKSSVPEPVAPQARPQQTPQRQVPLPNRPLALWLGQGLTAIALVWITNWAFHFTWRTADRLLRGVRWPVQLGLPGAYQTYTAWVVIGLVLLALASPWLLDLVLATWYRQRPLSIRQLQTHSPGTLRLLRQVCRQQGWQIPELRLIADSAPLCFSYGWLPRYTRIVISQGLLEQASDQALTTFYSYELARMVNGSLPVLSAVGLPLLLLHTGYRGLAQRADTLTQPLIQGLLGSGATLLYGLFWLLRQAVMWLSRLCCRWGDRRVVALTQHPDQMIEVLVEATTAIATHLQRHGTLHPLHTSLEVLMPVSSRQAIAPGGLLATPRGDRAAVLSTLLAIDGLNPYRQWLRVNASHQPLGERLLWLNQQALLRGQPSLTLEPEAAQPAPRSTATMSLPLLLLQKAPLTGLVAGGGLAMGLWFVGGVVNQLGWQRLSWLYQDPSILIGGLWLGLGLGLLLRINVLFPEPSNRPASNPSGETVATLLQRSSPVPVQGQPVSLQGKLRGLTGAGNWGCQELYLDDSSGLVKLINPVPLGSLQGLLQPQTHPLNWVGRRVTVTGWSRYGGGMLWVDINQVKLDQRHSFSTYGPAWATLISLISSLIGILTIFRGG